MFNKTHFQFIINSIYKSERDENMEKFSYNYILTGEGDTKNVNKTIKLAGSAYYKVYNSFRASHWN